MYLIKAILAKSNPNHAPSGGVIIDGKAFTHVEFIPGDKKASTILPDNDHTKAIPGQKTWKDYNLPDLRTVPISERIVAPPMIEQAETTKDALKILENTLGITDDKPNLHVTTPVEKVIISRDNLLHLVEKRFNARERYAEYILLTLTKPYEIWATQYDDGRRNRYIGLFTGKTDIAVVVKVNDDGSILWNVMNADHARINKFREGTLAWFPK